MRRYRKTGHQQMRWEYLLEETYCRFKWLGESGPWQVSLSFCPAGLRISTVGLLPLYDAQPGAEADLEVESCTKDHGIFILHGLQDEIVKSLRLMRVRAPSTSERRPMFGTASDQGEVIT